MYRLLITTILWLAVAIFAHGTTADIPVTSTSLDTSFYVFAVSTNAAPGGTAFHVTMTAKTGDIDTNYSSAGLEFITHTKQGGGYLVSSQELEPPISVTLRKEKKVWTADFVVSLELLEHPDLYFRVGFLATRMQNGKLIPMPSITSYEIRLEDFTGQISHALNGRWQTASGDTYEFTDNGTYDHWLQTTAISKPGQADASDPSNRFETSNGKFSINGNFLALTRNDGTGQTNLFYLTKGEVEGQTGKFFGTGYSFIMLSTNGMVSKYELMYRLSPIG